MRAVTASLPYVDQFSTICPGIFHSEPTAAPRPRQNQPTARPPTAGRGARLSPGPVPRRRADAWVCGSGCHSRRCFPSNVLTRCPPNRFCCLPSTVCRSLWRTAEHNPRHNCMMERSNRCTRSNPLMQLLSTARSRHNRLVSNYMVATGPVAHITAQNTTLPMAHTTDRAPNCSLAWLPQRFGNGDSLQRQRDERFYPVCSSRGPQNRRHHLQQHVKALAHSV